jgi:hypothetical protein
VRFFRSLGHSDGVVGGAALGVALLTGAALLSRADGCRAVVTGVLALALMLATGAVPLSA